MNDKETKVTLEEKRWTLDQALDRFSNKSHDALRRLRKTPTVWQEMVRDRFTDCKCFLADRPRSLAIM